VLARAQQVVRFDEEDDAELPPPRSARLAAVAPRGGRRRRARARGLQQGRARGAGDHAAIAWAARAGIPVVVDPKYRNFFAYRGATVFKPNRRELELALGAAVDLDHPDSLPDVFRRLGVEHLLLTLGERGMALFSAGGDVYRVPTTARDVYDVVGAGDTVTAYLATMLAAGATAREAAVIANFAAGVEVGKLGAATVTAEEVLAAYDAHVADLAPVPA
jgi:D-beta-D-heptose 7-phosphate kinase/D-beta-D-heptose 1-phosphate adenosyltransferase